jgi:hypothetical protein
MIFMLNLLSFVYHHEVGDIYFIVVEVYNICGKNLSIIRRQVIYFVVVYVYGR